MKKSDVVEVFKRKYADEVRDLDDRPSKVEPSIKASLLRQIVQAYGEAFDFLEKATSPAEYEEILLKLLNSEHYGDVVLWRIEELFLDFVLSEAQWEDDWKRP